MAETATLEPPTTTPAAEEAATLPTAEQEVQEAAARLIGNCSEVRVRVNWFGTSSKIDDETAVAMLKDTGADRKSVSLSKRLLSSKHDALAAVKDARKAIGDHVNAWTVPMLAVRSTGSEGITMRKDAGTRLIQKKDMEAFDERLQYLIGILVTAVRALQQALPTIKEEDRQRLGKLYRDSDYPTDVTKLVSVEVTYKTTAIDLDWEQLCPAIYERERVAANQRMHQVVENAAEEFCQRFVKYVQQVCGQLGNRQRLNPEKVVWHKYKDAEVVELVDHESDPDNVPEGHVWLQVRYAGKGGKSVTEWLDPIPAHVYLDELMPYNTTEKKKIFASSIDNIKQEMEAFLHVGDLLGPYRGVIAKGVEDVRALLTRVSKDQDPERIADQLRASDYVRDELRKTMDAAANIVRDAVVTVRRTRRNIDSSLVGMLND